MRAVLAIFAVAFVSCAAHAQTATEATPAAAAARPYRSIAVRFEAANVTHDGHLTLEQAKAGMPAIARHFDEIDTKKAGYLTLDQVRTYAVDWRRAHPDGVETKPQ